MEYITIEKFSSCCNKSIKTIEKNYKNIPGIEKQGRDYKIIEGTRYPCPIGKYKAESSGEKRYILLRAISLYQYIDEDLLKIPRKSFDIMVNELSNAGLIQRNGIDNPYGANMFDTTSKGDEVLRNNKEKAMRQISSIIGSFAGAFVREITV